jgi:hypothetical protein
LGGSLITAGEIQRNERCRGWSRKLSPSDESIIMLKFLGGTVGIIFIIGLIVVIALFKLVF